MVLPGLGRSDGSQAASRSRVPPTIPEVAQYYRIHPEEFTRGGTLMPFAEAEPVARERASAERRASTVTQWMRDLRTRAAISLPQ